ncbi:glycosyltransferase family 1 protein [Deinococcus sp. Leaf326]|uniref:glycosyltransferase family 1 protein n=1 Tax=Deinococcus sp. Leaf326 TaxID=1736338 RepID=UPI000701EB5D|nr:glycosyltransferase family 1 protein [Deinococcus sp. Leaf326]KQR31803.1 glycosyl transferase [Deinococcus sp. Leaf326]
MTTLPDLLCLSHLRWDFVYQRPQHLMSRAARDRRVYYVEDPATGAPEAGLQVRREGNVTVVQPQLPAGLPVHMAEAETRRLVHGLLEQEGVHAPLAWVYTPMQLPLLGGLVTSGVVYDCMDELANFRYAPPQLREREQQLFACADVVFTGGHRLYEAKREQHPHVYPFPSSVDVAHFAQARRTLPDPDDQAPLARPRLGFYGVIDERFDGALIGELAHRRPQWQIVLLGPVVKIAPEDLPRAANLHFLGMKSYADLPAYLAHWDVALLPFAVNEATEFISPTKTPEYLAAGVPVVSSPIRDVVRPYGEQGLVSVADGVDEFVAAISEALVQDHELRQRRADALLAQGSWDCTWEAMQAALAAQSPLTATAGRPAQPRTGWSNSPGGDD